MITTFLIFLLGGQQTTVSADWANKLQSAACASVGSRRIVAKRLPDFGSAGVTDDQRIAFAMNASAKAQEQAKSLRQQDDLKGASKVLVTHLETYAFDLGCRRLLFDISAERRDWRLAYAVLGPEVDATMTRDFLLRSSLAAAMSGEVYEGQRDYVMASIESGISVNRAEIAATSLPKGTTAPAVALLSAIAIGFQEANFSDLGWRNAEVYFLIALKLDPGNPFVCRWLGDVYDQQGRYLDAVLVLEKGAKRAVGGLKDDLMEELFWARAHVGN